MYSVLSSYLSNCMLCIREKREICQGGGIFFSYSSPGSGSCPGRPVSAFTPRDRSFSYCLPFQGLAVPLRKLCPCFVGALKEFQEDPFRCVCAAHILVAQEEQAFVGTVPGGIGTKSDCREAWRFRNRIRVERRRFERFVPWPKPSTDHFMRVGFTGDPISPFALGCASSRKARDRQVETPPEKMDRTALAEKRGAELLEDLVDLHQDAPEAVGIDGVLGGMHLIFITSNGMLHLTGHRIDRDLDPQGVQAGHEFPVKRSDGTGDQRHGSGGPLARANEEGVIDEVKLHFKGAASIR